MKNNTMTAKEFLLKAIQQMPGDFALQEAKWHLFQALNKMEKVEDKRYKREILQQEENKKLIGKKSLSDPRASSNLDILDKMIGEEKENIQKMIDKNKKNIDGNDYIQTILG